MCRQEFGYGLTDEGVHILDPFTGTGTFIVRLLESGIIRPEDLARKYSSALWANEIMLLAYYIACVNIETTYQAVAQAQNPDTEVAYQPFAGATLTDTFQITEEGDKADTSLIPVNNDRIEAQLASPIKVIVGNPPYSVGQGSANDDNANLKYPTLDRRVAQTYVAQSAATSSRTMYDSYVRAFRWTSDRIGDQGVIALVSNNGWIDSNSADGIRKSLTGEFSHIWVYNLRGNQRTAGELSRQEGGKVFGSGARTGVAVLIALKRPDHGGACALRYFASADYLDREKKLADISVANLASVPWIGLVPNESGDWVNQRNERFVEYPTLGSKDRDLSAPAYFNLYSLGLATGRDAWCYSFANSSVRENMDSADH